ncbi:hypothetical protein [Micromonospora sp. 050-3]|uniref:hypothetical protein n=1 Tax=Micromonospora sp. 050-3 TaxID=2789265 RepID=UPI00397AD46F
MSETLAATGAQTIPVFALAAVIELRAVFGRFPLTQPWTRAAARESWFLEAGTLAVGHLLWGGVMIWLVVAEYQCLRRLRGLPVPDDAPTNVQNSIIAALVLLVVLPVAASLMVNVIALVRPTQGPQPAEAASTGAQGDGQTDQLPKAGSR